MMDQDKLFEECIDEYEEFMMDGLETASCTSELEICHRETKTKILASLESKSQNVAEDLREKLIKEMNLTFKKLNRMFEKRNIRQEKQLAEISIANDVLLSYSEEMNKLFANNPNITIKEVEEADLKIFKDAVGLAESKCGGQISSGLMTTLKRDIEIRHRNYLDRAEMILKSKEDPAIGIDLGTTMCCVMVFFKGKCELIENRSQRNARTTPSCVAFHEDGKDTFGIDAKEEAYKYPETTIYDAKRMIGRHFLDPNLQSDLKKWPFEVVNDNGNVKIKTWNRMRYPHEVSARLLTRFRLMAEDFLKLPRGSITKAVITVPAYFTEPQRRATCEAATCAGLKILNILSEPTAAAIAYSWERCDAISSRNALIYDLGGGTFDVAIAKVTNTNVEILGVEGDTHLGGQDFDQLLMEYCIQEFKNKENFDLASLKESSQDTIKLDARRALSRLKLQCEIAKERLSTSDSTVIQVERFYGTKDLRVNMTKFKFERMVRPLVRSTIDIMERAISDAKAKGIQSKQDIDDIIMIGGSTRMPIVMEMVSNFFVRKQLSKNINPDEAVARGAAIQAALLNKNGDVKHIMVQDVTPMSLGTDVVGDKMSIVIPKNSKIPCSFKHIYCTVSDNQTKMKWNIYQGDDPVVSRNNLLGEFYTEGLPPMPAGKQKAKCTMTFDSMGILHVSAVSKTTGESNSITIQADRMGIDSATMTSITNECQQITQF